MHLFNFVLALLAAFSMVVAVPVEQDSAIQGYASHDGSEIVARDVGIQGLQNEGLGTLGCPNGWRYCGRCNGTRCKVAGINYNCKSGTSCTQQSGGGDGKICGTQYLIDEYSCPGSKSS